MKHYCERRAVESIVVHDIVPVFTGETIEEVEAFLNTRSKKTRDKKPYKANPDSVVNVFI
ncbi:MAG TPA: hypothetical protein VI911_10595 [Patescibacteria group bacterium]|nr:hypothetical protein [Patescibacteria group bacterium]